MSNMQNSLNNINNIPNKEINKFNQYIQKLKEKPYLIIVILLMGFLCYNGTLNYWYQFKQYIVVSELKKEGIELQREELTILKDKSKLDSAIIEQSKEVENIDYQAYKKVELEKKVKHDKVKNNFAKKGIIVTDSDIDKLIESNELLSKYGKNP